MANDKPEDDNGFSIIHPPNPLKDKVKKTHGTLDDLLKNAEKMLTSIGHEFDTFVDQAVLKLGALFREKWMNANSRPEAIREFTSIANDLKGKSGSFNYALLGNIADLFRDYLDDTPAAEQKPAAVLSYIDALGVVWKQKITGDGGMIGKAIVSDLIKLNEKAVSRSR